MNRTYFSRPAIDSLRVWAEMQHRVSADAGRHNTTRELAIAFGSGLPSLVPRSRSNAGIGSYGAP